MCWLRRSLAQSCRRQWRRPSSPSSRTTSRPSRFEEVLLSSPRFSPFRLSLWVMGSYRLGVTSAATGSTFAEIVKVFATAPEKEVSSQAFKILAYFFSSGLFISPSPHLSSSFIRVIDNVC